MKKKIVALVMCMVLLVAVSITGTLAYLTSQDSVTNTFTVGKVAITLDEAKVNVNGQPVKVVAGADGETTEVVDKADAPRVDANTYKLLPGKNYTKDPIIHVGSDSETCFLVVYVDNKLTGIETTVTAGQIAAQMSNNGWTQYNDTNYWYYNKNAAAGLLTGMEANSNIPLFEAFTVNTAAYYDGAKDDQGAIKDTNALNLANYDGKTIEIKAFAIQADNVTNSVDTILGQAQTAIGE